MCGCIYDEATDTPVPTCIFTQSPLKPTSNIGPSSTYVTCWAHEKCTPPTPPPSSHFNRRFPLPQPIYNTPRVLDCQWILVLTWNQSQRGVGGWGGGCHTYWFWLWAPTSGFSVLEPGITNRSRKMEVTMKKKSSFWTSHFPPIAWKFKLFFFLQ